MKKTIMVTLVAATLLSTNVMANNTGHIGNPSGKDNDIEIVVGDIDNVMGNICNQSGSNNECEIEIGNVAGDVVISDGATVIISGEGGGDKGDKGDTGAAGADGITTVVNEYDKGQVDQDFVSEDELVSVTNEVTKNSQNNDNQQIEIDRNKDAVVDLNNRVDETYDAMREGDEQLQTQVNDVNDRVTDVQQTLYEEGVIRAESDRIVAANAQKKLDAAIAAQGEVDTAQDNRMTKAETELYSTTARSKQNEAAIFELQDDVKGLRKGIAMSAALGFGSNLHTKSHNGNWTLTPSIANYEGNTAVALTAQVSVTDNMAVRLGYSNVAQDLLEVDKGIVGAAVTFSFGD